MKTKIISLAIVHFMYLWAAFQIFTNINQAKFGTREPESTQYD